MTNKLADWLVEIDIPRLQAAMEQGRATSVEIVSGYLARISAYDPLLRSILELNPDALEIAEALDRERRERGSRGMLHGIPIVLKDNIDTHDRMHTSAGSLALADSIAPADAFLAVRLREAGAVLLGKANMTEWANYMSSSMWAGYSSRGGLTLNPYGPGKLFVGGSSSGSAAAVAANLCAASIGTETSGSIISPASWNRLVGIKPTLGLVSRSGIIPITRSQDTAGPMARTVTDAAIVLGALTGADARDPTTLEHPERAYRDYTPFLRADGLRGARIGIPRYYCRELDAVRLSVFEAAIDALRREGAVIIDPVSLPSEASEWDWHVLRYEFKWGINDYLSRLDPAVPVRTLRDVIAFNAAHADRALKYGQDVMEYAETSTSGTLTEPEYIDSLRRSREMARSRGIDHALAEHRLDALLFLGDEGGSDLAARAGYPSVTVPGGYADTDALASEGYPTRGPQGITFVGAAYSEPTLLRLAYGFEQATRHRAPPSL
ncbi:amidase family protein [Cohnella sp. REN36]|uniref:amidase family protein n=1 Tax=Cohnella sp. REN36 TaxID=2887347 RepID=UPI001D139DF5|nr:amidase family protein [Cohnella sp. REN36]MCC3377266.1 amidase [Cohnella sp. REN36]